MRKSNITVGVNDAGDAIEATLYYPDKDARAPFTFPPRALSGLAEHGREKVAYELGSWLLGMLGMQHLDVQQVFPLMAMPAGEPDPMRAAVEAEMARVDEDLRRIGEGLAPLDGWESWSKK